MTKKLSADSASAEPASPDGLDENVWKLVVGIAVAASRGDLATFVSATERLTGSLPLERQRLAGVYIRYLLRHRIVVLAGHLPAQIELSTLATVLDSQYSKLVPGAPAELLADTLATAFNLASAESEVTGGRFAVSSSAILGILLDNTEQDLSAMRPDLAKYWLRHAKNSGAWALDSAEVIDSTGRITTR